MHCLASRQGRAVRGSLREWATYGVTSGPPLGPISDSSHSQPSTPAPGGFTDYFQVDVLGGRFKSHMETLVTYKLDFTQNYYTFTLTLDIKIVSCSKFP